MVALVGIVILSAGLAQLSTAWYEATVYHDCDTALIYCDYAMITIATGFGLMLIPINPYVGAAILAILAKMELTFCADTIGKACQLQPAS